MRQSTYLLMIGMLTITGCVASGPKFSYVEPADSSSTIYIYRPYSFVGSAASPNIYFDGSKQGRLDTGGYIPIVTSPGDHEIVVGRLGSDNPNWGPDNFTMPITIVQNSEYFLRFETDSSGASAPMVIPGAIPMIIPGGMAKTVLTTVNKDIAIKELEETKLSK